MRVTTIKRVTLAAGSGDTLYEAPPQDGGSWYLESASILPHNTSATDGSNYATVTLRNGSTSLGSTTTNSSGGAALTAAQKTALTLSGGVSREFDSAPTGANTEAANLLVAHTGTGVALDFDLLTTWTRIR